MPTFEKSPLTTISRDPHRGSYDQATIYAILDEAIDVTISYIENGLPRAIPTGFVRLENTIYIHGSTKSHFVQQLLQAGTVCLTVSILDGLVLANTAFNHSFNYRSVVAYSTPYAVEDDNLKIEALKVFTDKLIPGRWEDAIKKPTPEELKVTALVGLPLEQASAKMRQGPPNNNKTYTEPVWTGQLPLRKVYKAPIVNSETIAGMDEPAYLKRLYSYNIQEQISGLKLD